MLTVARDTSPGKRIEYALAEVALERSKLRSDPLKQQAIFAGGALVGPPVAKGYNCHF